MLNSFAQFIRSRIGSLIHNSDKTTTKMIIIKEDLNNTRDKKTEGERSIEIRRKAKGQQKEKKMEKLDNIYSGGTL